MVQAPPKPKATFTTADGIQAALCWCRRIQASAVQCGASVANPVCATGITKHIKAVRPHWLEPSQCLTRSKRGYAATGCAVRRS